MTTDWDLTCWRGIRIRHPAEWELMRANKPDQPGRCVFADRLYQRLDVCWMPVTYVPNLELLLDKHRQAGDKKSKPVPLEAAPPPWQGLLRKTDSGYLVHAFRFFKAARLLVEAVIVWPDQRDEGVENEILTGLDADQPESPTRQWQAMGISLTLSDQYELTESTTTVGHINWQFTRQGQPEPELSVDRIAMAEYWLDRSLGDWLEKDLDETTQVLERRVVNYNGHQCQQLITSGKMGTLSSLRGLRLIKLDRAWLCPAEGRVYRIGFWRRSRVEEISLPTELVVRCCRPVPVVKLSRIS